MARIVKNLPGMRETQVQSLGWEDPLEKGMETHSSILAWRIPWTEEPSGCVHGVTESDTTGKRVCLPAQETAVPSLGREDPLGEVVAARSRVLAWRIPWTE